MENKKRSFFERLTGSMSVDEEQESGREYSGRGSKSGKGEKNDNNWMEEKNDEAEL